MAFYYHSPVLTLQPYSSYSATGITLSSGFLFFLGGLLLTLFSFKEAFFYLCMAASMVSIVVYSKIRHWTRAQELLDVDAGLDAELDA